MEGVLWRGTVQSELSRITQGYSKFHLVWELPKLLSGYKRGAITSVS